MGRVSAVSSLCALADEAGKRELVPAGRTMCGLSRSWKE